MGGAILVLSGPSGAGKSTIIQQASREIGVYYFSISTTTRAPREGEREGVNYHFVTLDSFQQDIQDGNFLEHAQVHNNFYGTSLKPVTQALLENKLVIFDIDVQGHRLVREKLNDITTSAFITPPTPIELEKRLRSRNTDDEATIQRRMDNAASEIAAISEYDFCIINEDIEKAVKEFIAIANAARLKMSQAIQKEFVSNWLDK